MVKLYINLNSERENNCITDRKSPNRIVCIVIYILG